MFNQETADTICARLAEGESLRSVCRSEGMPSIGTFLLWVSERPQLADQYTRARSICVDIGFEGLNELADEPPERTLTGAVDPGWVTWQKNRIEARKWAFSKIQPKKYGDKIAIGGADDLPPIRAMTDEQLAARVKALQERVGDNAKPG